MSSADLDDANMDESSRYRCHLCATTFSRRAHLQRHYNAHFIQKPLKCGFCSATLRRGDALRKHWKTCKVRQVLQEEIPPQLPPGRRRRACDNCVSLKQGCDLNVPCGSCSARSHPCTYGRASDVSKTQNGSHSLSDISPCHVQATPPLGSDVFSLDLLGLDNSKLDFADFNPQRDPTHVAHSMSQTIITTFEFLSHLTTGSGLEDTFNFVPRADRSRSSWPDGMLDSLMLEHFPPELACSVAPTEQPTDPNMVEISQMMSWLSHPLFSSSKAIWDSIQRAERFHADPYGPSAAQGAQGKSYMDFFNPFDLEMFLHFYWSRWSYNCPIIHMPSFDPTEAPAALTWVLALFGALMSTNEEHSSSARLWLDSAEYAVFQDPFLKGESKDISEQDLGDSLRENLRILQSALLICVLQNWEGSDAARKRIRRLRFSAVVFAARDLGFARARHTDDIDLDQNYINWPLWIFREELIRTQTFVFLLDAEIAIFNNIPPRIAISELAMSPTCSEPMFQATNAADLSKTLRTRDHRFENTRTELVRDLVDILCSANDTGKRPRSLTGLTALNLFTLIMAIIRIISCPSMSPCFLPSAITAMRVSLVRWHNAWDRRLQFEDGDWSYDQASQALAERRDGFVRHAPEFQTLASLMLDELLQMANRSVGGSVAVPSNPGFIGDISEIVSRARGPRTED